VILTGYRVSTRHQQYLSNHISKSTTPEDCGPLIGCHQSGYSDVVYFGTLLVHERLRHMSPPHVTLATGAATSLNFPAAHAVHVVPAMPLKNVPAAQLAQTLSEVPPATVLDLPIAHATHELAVLAPVVVRYVPAAQSVHADAPHAAWNLPAPHGVHALAVEPPVAALNVPGLHR